MSQQALRGKAVATRRARRTRAATVLGPDWKLAYGLLLPAAVILIGFIAYPFLYSIWLSLNNIRVGGAAKFIGLQNYYNLLFGPNHAELYNSALVTVEYTFGAEIAKFLIGMITALILHSAIKARSLFRAFLFLPWAIPGVVSAYSWRWMYDDRLGILNNVLLHFGIIQQPVLWLSSIKFALWAVVAATVWQGTPFWTMTYLAGLQSIPGDLYEAAEIDGASTVQKFFRITMPNMTTVIIVTFMLSSIWTANGLQYVYILTNGGPANATETFPLMAYTLGMRSYNLGMGAAIPLLFFPFFAVMIFFLTRRMLREAD